MSLPAEVLTNVKNGITSADVNFYAIGGTVLVVLAGLWGFQKVKELISDKSEGIHTTGDGFQYYDKELYDKYWGDGSDWKKR